MSRDEAQKLLGGYATGTLTPEEQQALFEAALEDQSLFDQLAKEQPLHELLADRSVRAQLLASLDGRPDPWYRRWASWGLPAAATALIVAGLLVWRVNQKEARPTQVAQVMQPAATPAEPTPKAALPEPAAASPRPAAPASARANEREAAANPEARPQAGKPRAVGSLDNELKTANQPLAGEKDKAAASADSLKLRDAKAESARRADSAPGAVSGTGGGVVGGIVGGMPGGLVPAAPPPPPPAQPSTVAAPAAPRASATAGLALGGRMVGATNGFLSASSTLAGVVKDATGAALPGADVKIFANDGNAAVASAKTGSQGEFVAPLSPGVYRLQVLAPGFQAYNRDVTFDDALATPLPITLQVGAATETVMVTAQAGAAGAQQAGQQGPLQQTTEARQRTQAQFGTQLAQVQTGSAGGFTTTTVKILRKQPDGSMAEAKADDLHVGDSVTFEITPNAAGLLTLTENSNTPPLVNRVTVQAGKPFDAPAIVLTAAGVRQFAAQIEPGAAGGGGGGGGLAGFAGGRGGSAKSAKKQTAQAKDDAATGPILIRITVR